MLILLVAIIVLIIMVGTRLGSNATRREIRELKQLAALPEEEKARRYLADPGGHKAAARRALVFLALAVVGLIALIVLQK